MTSAEYLFVVSSQRQTVQAVELEKEFDHRG